MLNLSRDGFTHEQIVAALHSTKTDIRFRYELLDFNNRLIRLLNNVTDCSVSFNMFRDIKRNATFTLTEGMPIDYLNYRIRPIMEIFIPKGILFGRRRGFASHLQTIEIENLSNKGATGWARFPLGVFLLSSPSREDQTAGVIRDIAAYDLSKILIDDKFTARYTVTAETNFKNAAVHILNSANIYDVNIEDTDKTLPRDIEFEIGETKLSAINKLLGMINYTPIHVDEYGYFTSRLYVAPNERATDYIYYDDKKSVIFKGARENLDYFDVANKWVVVMSNEEQDPLVSVLENNDPESPTSIPSRNGFVTVDAREIDNIADQEALDGYTARIAFEASQVYGQIEWESALMPFHGFSNVLGFRYEDLGIEGKFLELSWEMDLSVQGRMKHTLRQVVTV